MACICMFRLEYTNVIFDSRVLREAETLSGRHRVCILDVLGDEAPLVEEKGGVRIERIPLVTKKLPSILKFLKYVEYVAKAAARGWRKKCDIYHAHDLPALLPAMIAAKLNGGKVVYDSHELWTEMGNLNRIFSRIAGWYEGVLIRRTDRVLVANRSRAGIMGERYPECPPIDVLMNCPPLNSEDLSGGSLPASGTGHRRTVLYQGGLSFDRGIENLVSAAEHLRDDVALVLLGRGPLKDRLEQEVALKHLEGKVFFQEYVPYRELLKYTASADAGVVIYRNTCLNNYYCAPNKLFEYVAAEIPVAACRFPEPESIVTEYGIGRLFDPDDPRSIAQAINGLFESEEEYDRMKANTRAVRDRFNWSVESGKLKSVYEELLKGNREKSAA